MTITGQFRNVNDDLITLTISNNIGSQVITIGENGLFFTADPITIEYQAEDLFTHIICTKATINLSTKDYLGDLLFTNEVRGYEVLIKINTQNLFYGYLDVNTFNQPYIKGLNEFSLTAVDYLSTLQYYNYKDCTVLNYDVLKQNADTITFKSIIDNILNYDGIVKYYDKSKGKNSSRLNNVLNDCAISEIQFYGDDFDDVWKQSEVLEELLKYLNLHIIQLGKNVYIFDWNTIKEGVTVWRNLNTNANATLRNSETIFASGVFADSDTNITIDDVYSQLQLTCNLESMDTLIENPLDKESLTSPYSGKQLYMTEYISEGTGDNANDAFNDMVDGESNNYDEAKSVDWFLQYMENPKWKFYIDGQSTIDTILEQSSGKYINQWKIPKYLKKHSCVPAIFRMGNVEHKGGEVKDNAPVSKVNQSDYLYISVNGNTLGIDEEDAAPNEATIRSQSPMMEYVANQSGGIFSPADDNTTNYLVFSGKILLQPIQWESGINNCNRDNNYELIKNGSARKTEGVSAVVPYYDEPPLPVTVRNIIKSENNGEGRYYTRKFYTMTNPSDTNMTYSTDGTPSLQPWTDDKSARGLEYNYSATGDGSDRYSKVPILECELKIGDKRLIETNIDEYGNSTFQWVTIGEEPTASYVDVDGTTKTYTITTFSLGINPKIDDKIIGTEFPIQNTISYQLNIDAEGTAIPIKRSDRVSGKVEFTIIGLINTTWNEITRRHPSFWRHTKWYSNTHSILAYTENVVIKEFSCKIYSDNSLNDNTNNNKDLVYISNETTDIVNKKDDLEFKFVTQLGADECREKGISTSVNINAVIDATDNLTLNDIYDARTGEEAKAEEHYINQYYLEYHEPKMILETSVHDVSTNFNYLLFRDLFFSPTLNKHFYILGMERHLRLHTNTLKLREI